jgi:cell filamentation protein
MADPYLDPATGVLRNRLGLTTEAELRHAEAQITLAKMTRLDQHPVPGTFDLPHLQAIHKEIFGDIYPWAGEIRSIEVAKGTPFCPVGNIPSFAGDIFRGLARDNHLRGVDQQTFTHKAAELLGDINALHPFREGNGRAQRAFLSHVADHAGYTINWSGLDPRENLEASMASFRGDNRRLEAMLQPRVSPAARSEPAAALVNGRSVSQDLPQPAMASAARFAGRQQTMNALRERLGEQREDIRAKASPAPSRTPSDRGARGAAQHRRDDRRRVDHGREHDR